MRTVWLVRVPVQPALLGVTHGAAASRSEMRAPHAPVDRPVMGRALCRHVPLASLRCPGALHALRAATANTVARRRRAATHVRLGRTRQAVPRTRGPRARPVLPVTRATGPAMYRRAAKTLCSQQRGQMRVGRVPQAHSRRGARVQHVQYAVHALQVAHVARALVWW